MTILKRSFFRFLPAFMGCAVVAVCTASEPVLLAEDGVARFPVVVAPAAGDNVRALAADLADTLGRISGATFEVIDGVGTNGLAVGIYPADFPELSPEIDFDPSDPLRREDYLLRTHAHGAWLLGATESAVGHAVWDFLYRLGYRQFFPTETWEVVPDDPSPALAVDRLEQPAFSRRDIVSDYGRQDALQPGIRRWIARNRGGGSLYVGSSPIYGMIIRDNIEAFEHDPEFRALQEDGSRQGRNFCIASPDLRRLVSDWAVAQFKLNPLRDGISMTPSDDEDGWCLCEDCEALGSISDRVILLANTVAEAINALETGPKYVGILAQHRHAAAPADTVVHPNVIVNVPYDDKQSGDSVIDVHAGQIADWRQQGAMLGVNDYLSVYAWDFSLPGRAKASNLRYIRESIPRFHERGARFYNAAFGNDWGSAGPGIYLASRILWDIEEADRHENIMNDFMEKCFGTATNAMGAYYALIDGDNQPLLSADLLGRMYRLLDEAQEGAGDDARIRERIRDLIFYTRYVELFFRFRNASGNDRQIAYDDLRRFIERIADRGMINDRMATMILARRNQDLASPEYRDPIGAPDADETRAILDEGIENNQIIEFTKVTFTDNLVPAATALGLETEAQRGEFGDEPVRHRKTVYTWVEEPGELTLIVHGDPGRDGTSVSEITLYPPADESAEAADRFTGILEREQRYLVLKTDYRGLHRIEAHGPSFRIDFADPDRQKTVPVNLDEMNDHRLWSLYFFVPQGTGEVVGFSSNPQGTVVDSDGKQLFDFSAMNGPGYFNIPVPEGQDGRLWMLRDVRGSRQLMTVPPYFAATAKGLLLPKEIVNPDD